MLSDNVGTVADTATRWYPGHILLVLHNVLDRRGLVQRFAPTDCRQDVGDNVLLGSMVPTSAPFPGRCVVCCGRLFEPIDCIAHNELHAGVCSYMSPMCGHKK